MNSGLPVSLPKSLMNKPNSTGNTKTSNTTPDWMLALGLAPKKPSANRDIQGKGPTSTLSGTSEEAKRLAAAALSAVKDVTSAASGRGKVEVTEVRDFAGEDIEVKKLVDADSKEAAEEAKIPATPQSALDTILERIKKKPKHGVLNETKKDWGAFKEENKGLEQGARCLQEELQPIPGQGFLFVQS